MIVAAAAFLVLGIVLLISFCTFRTVFYSPADRHPTPADPLVGWQYDEVAGFIQQMTEIMTRIPCEHVTIRSFDGTMLHGRCYLLRDGAPLAILCHGYRSCAFRDCSGSHALSRKMGFNALVIDQRAHGESGGRVITFGIRERLDLLEWISYSRSRFGADIPMILSGLSMGAATVLMAAGLDLPDNVAAIIADSPYSSPIGIIGKVCADRGYPAALCRPFIRLGARLFGRFRLDACSARDAVRRTEVPVLLLHGEADLFVPCSMSREIAACCAAPVMIKTFPDAGHGLCYLSDPVAYECAVYEFLRDIPAVGGEISESFGRKFDRWLG